MCRGGPARGAPGFVGLWAGDHLICQARCWIRFAGCLRPRAVTELAWRDVALHACWVLQAHEKVIFATAWQMADNTAQLQYARDDGYRVVVVPDDIARSLGGLTDLDGRPLVDVDKYRDEWNGSFLFDFVGPDAMTPGEREVCDRIPELCALAGVSLAWPHSRTETPGTSRVTCSVNRER